MKASKPNSGQFLKREFFISTLAATVLFILGTLVGLMVTSFLSGGKIKSATFGAIGVFYIPFFICGWYIKENQRFVRPLLIAPLSACLAWCFVLVGTVYLQSSLKTELVLPSFYDIWWPLTVLALPSIGLSIAGCYFANRHV